MLPRTTTSYVSRSFVLTTLTYHKYLFCSPFASLFEYLSVPYSRIIYYLHSPACVLNILYVSQTKEFSYLVSIYVLFIIWIVMDVYLSKKEMEKQGWIFSVLECSFFSCFVTNLFEIHYFEWYWKRNEGTQLISR